MEFDRIELLARRLAIFFLAFVLAAACASLFAQNQPQETPIIKITGAAQSKVPIAIPPFTGSENAATLHDVVRDDLLFSNYFKLVPDEYYKLVQPFTGKKTDYKEWQGIGADAVLVGTSQENAAAGGRPAELMFEARMYDTNDESMPVGKRYRADTDQTRLLAHKMSDEIVRRYTGKPGIATSRIRVAGRQGQGNLPDGLRRGPVEADHLEQLD
jgi:TolB protein